VLVLFAGVTAIYVHPLLGQLGTHLPVDTGDPGLNAAVLGWNAVTVPLTTAWWNQPWFHPATGVTAFTENMLGLSPISAPAYWLSGSAVVAYNVVFVLSWPLSALAMYFLVRRLTGRADAGIVAGFAFAFTPFRATAELGHLQALCAFWLPVAIGAMHAYLEDRRPRWLLVLGVAWVLHSLSNGYYMFFAAVLIAAWLAYFGTTSRTWRAAVHLTGTLALSSVALLPVLIGYYRIHDQYGLRRTFDEAAWFSSRLDSWFQAPAILRFWGGVLPEGQHSFFPGLTVLLMVLVAIAARLSQPRPGANRTRARAILQTVMALLTVVSVAGLAWYVGHGPWSIYRSGQTYFKMSDPYRAMAVLALCGIPLLWMAPVREALAARRPIVFYVLGTGLMALLSCGPILRVGEQVILERAPYRLLMWLPGFAGLRVPSRFWMMGVFCLAAAAGIGYASLVPRKQRIAQLAVGAIACAGLLGDGWLKVMPTRLVPPLWSAMRGADPRLPLLELPMGPGGLDSVATLRTTSHRRRVLNGVSGYEPPHYPPMQEGLLLRDPEMLKAIASLGAFEVSIERASDSDGRWRQYVLGAPGAVLVAEDGERAIVRVPAAAWEPLRVGAPLPIASVRASAGDARRLIDGRLDTDWGTRQQGVEWLLADLGSVRIIGGVSLAIQKHSAGFPRHLAIDVSNDGERFEQVWEGNGVSSTFLAVIRAPITAWLRVGFPAREARYVRLRQTLDGRGIWVVPELEVNSPPPGGRP
jgi:hypothetical protein